MVNSWSAIFKILSDKKYNFYFQFKFLNGSGQWVALGIGYSHPYLEVTPCTPYWPSLFHRPRLRLVVLSKQTIKHWLESKLYYYDDGFLLTMGYLKKKKKNLCLVFIIGPSFQEPVSS